MLYVLVLVCSLAITPDLADCNKTNAVDVISLPEPYASPVTCFMHGEAYYAQTAMARDLAEDERIKVICSPKRQ